MTLLEVENLRVTFPTPSGPFEAVRGVSFSLGSERLGIVGESGSGKTMTGRSILRLIRPPGRVEADVMRFDGQDLLTLPERRMRRSERVSRSCPSKVMASASTRPGGRTRRRMDRPVIVLPDPLSPTMPRRSEPRVNETPRTASNGPEGVSKVTRRLRTSRRVTRPPSGPARRAARLRAG